MAVIWESPPSSLHTLLQLKVLDGDGSSALCEEAAHSVRRKHWPHTLTTQSSAHRCGEDPLTTTPLLKGMITAIGGLKRGSEPPVNE